MTELSLHFEILNEDLQQPGTVGFNNQQQPKTKATPTEAPVVFFQTH